MAKHTLEFWPASQRAHCGEFGSNQAQTLKRGQKMEAVAASLLNATNATNATVVPEEPSDMYELLQRQ